MNDKIKEMLNGMAAYEAFKAAQAVSSGERQIAFVKMKAYQKAVASIASIDFEITKDNLQKVKGLPGVGPKILEKITNLINLGKLPTSLENFRNSKYKNIQEIAEIKGIGMVKAKKLIDNGITSLEELKRATQGLHPGDMIKGLDEDIKLTNEMQIGLEYEAHTEKNRMSVGEHASIVYPMIKVIEKLPGVAAVSAAGSARRYDGSENYTIGDVDLIVGIKGQTASPKLIESLKSLLDKVTESGPKKIGGIKNRRHVDIKIANEKDYGALLLHATGPMSFNIYCRNAAIKKGWKLNEYGLFSETGECLSKDEAEILDLLGIGWVEPKDRKNIH